ncbi:hypothetical protein V6U90_03445 [Micromonospora sp. CPCC 206060]|uniref:hypothetical protein n=1 Tax=Micromonospora sp. CPCC 206060 TaxID=3122406 RepID=UPI002FF30C63
MAHRSWGRPLPTAFAVALLAGSTQLGVGYGLGLLRLPPRLTDLTADQWAAQLTWAAWIAMVATVIGALVGGRPVTGTDPDQTDPIQANPDQANPIQTDPIQADPDQTNLADTDAVDTDADGRTDRAASEAEPTGRTGRAASVAGRLAVCAVAAVGALVVALFSAFPARTVPVGTVGPVAAVGLAVGLAVSFGVLIAFAALGLRPVRRNVTLVTGALWALAVGAVVPALGPTDPLPQIRLGMPGAGVPWLPAPLVIPALALLAGLLVGLLARRQGDRSPWAGGAGAAGPAMLAVSHLVAGVGAGQQATPYWTTLLAVGTGTLGSTLAVVWRWPLVTRRTPSTAIEPTDILLPLPRPATGAEEPDPEYDGEITDVETAGEPEPARPTTTGPNTAPALATHTETTLAPHAEATTSPGMESTTGPSMQMKSSAGPATEPATGLPDGPAPERDDPPPPPPPTTPGPGTGTGTGTGTDDPTIPVPETPPGRGERSRRGLFRRGRAERSPDTPAGRDGDAPLPDQDAEYVDWVNRLSNPVPDPVPRRDDHIPRRTLRSPGRHQAD